MAVTFKNHRERLQQLETELIAFAVSEVAQQHINEAFEVGKVVALVRLRKDQTLDK